MKECAFYMTHRIQSYLLSPFLSLVPAPTEVLLTLQQKTDDLELIINTRNKIFSGCVSLLFMKRLLRVFLDLE